MRLVLLTEAPVNETHGTGCLLLRLLSGTGIDATNVYPLSESGGASSLPSVVVPEKKQAGAKVLRLVRRAKRLALLQSSSIDHAFAVGIQHEVPQDAAQTMAQADLVLCSVFSLYGLQFAQACLTSAPASLPVIFWFLDCSLHREFIPNAIEQFLRRLSPRVWAFNAPIKNTLERALPVLAGGIDIKFWLGVDVPQILRKPKKRDGSIRCVMIGNFWDLGMVDVLQTVWRHLRESLSQCGPLAWFANPQAPERLKMQGVALGPEVRYQGYAASLSDALEGADAAIVPFSISTARLADYARHSFPSRIADYCAHGVPVFALAPEDSLVAGYIAQHGIGISHDAVDARAAAARLAAFLTDPKTLDECGRKARSLAEQEFDLTKVRQRFLDDLTAAMK
jgi:glycosyltransferase involved in cell wall biosynthesis